MRYGPQDMTNMMGIGSYVGEVRRFFRDYR